MSAEVPDRKPLKPNIGKGFRRSSRGEEWAEGARDAGESARILGFQDNAVEIFAPEAALEQAAKKSSLPFPKA
jgi:hypothetical protein